MKNRFSFRDPDLAQLGKRGYLFCVEGAGITDQLQIFETFGEGLKAPNGYFGENWNAFNDCLLDLQWIKTPEIFIVHRELPRLSHTDIGIYLDIILQAVILWEDEKTEELHRLYPDFIPHRLTVFFPRELESLISAYIGNDDALSTPSPRDG